MNLVEKVKRIVYGAEQRILFHQCTTCGVTFDAASSENRTVECPNCASTRVLELPDE